MNLPDFSSNHRRDSNVNGLLKSDSSRKIVLTKTASDEILLQATGRDSLGFLSNQDDARKYSFGDESVGNGKANKDLDQAAPK